MTENEFQAIKSTLLIYDANCRVLASIEGFIEFANHNPHAHIDIEIKSGAYDKSLGDNELQGFMPILHDFLSRRKQDIEDRLATLSIIAPQPADKDDEIPF